MNEHHKIHKKHVSHLSCIYNVSQHTDIVSKIKIFYILTTYIRPQQRNEHLNFVHLSGGVDIFFLGPCTGTGYRMGVIQTGIPETVFDVRRRDGKVKETCFENTFIVYIRL